MAIDYSKIAESAVSAGALGASAFGPVGLVAGLGAGAIAGAAAGESEAERQQRMRLEELRRKQELGQLGYTEQEMSVQMAKEFGAMAQQQRAQREQQAALMAGQDLGAGVQAMQRQEQDAIRRQEAEDLRQAQDLRQLQERERQRQELEQREAIQLVKEQEEREAMLQALSQGASQIQRTREMAFLQQQAEDIRDQEKKKRAEQAEAAAVSAEQARLSAYGNQTIQNIQSSPTVQFGSQPLAGQVVAPGFTSQLDPLMNALLERQLRGADVYDLQAAQSAGLLALPPYGGVR